MPSLFKVCGNPDATLSHFEGVEVTFAYLRFAPSKNNRVASEFPQTLKTLKTMFLVVLRAG